MGGINIKDAYQTLCQDGVNNVSSPHFVEIVWNKFVSSKVSTFLWDSWMIDCQLMWIWLPKAF